MLAIDDRAAHLSHSQGAYFDGSLALLRELAVTNNVDAALPRLSAIVSKMLPHDALRMACFDQRGRPIVNASTADVPDMMAPEVDEVIIDDLSAGALGASAAPHGAERLVGAGYRSVLGVSTRAPEPLVRVAFLSKRPLAFNRTHVPLARRIAYHLGLGACRGELGRVTPQIGDDRAPADRRGRAARRRPSAGRYPSSGRRRVRRMARGAAEGDAGRPDAHDRARDRRVGHWQGSRGAVHPCGVGAEERAVRGTELRRAARAAARVGAVWIRARCVHERAAPQARAGGAGVGRRAVPRRGQRDEPVRAGQVPAGVCRSASSSGSAGRASSRRISG